MVKPFDKPSCYDFSGELDVEHSMGKSQIMSALSALVVGNHYDLSDACNTFGVNNRYFGPSYQTRETMKAHARELQNNASDKDKALGFLLEAKAHFYRSLERAQNQRQRHPEFVEYFCHWLHADPSFMPEVIFKQLAAWFVKPDVVCIRKGGTYFYAR